MPKMNVNENSLGLSGYDPVSYFDGNPVEGNENFSSEYIDVNYRLVSADNVAKFKKNPAKYAPQYGGWCAVAVSEGKYAPANPKTYVIQDEKLFVFYNAEQGNTLPQWEENPEGRKVDADKHWQDDDIVDPT